MRGFRTISPGRFVMALTLAGFGLASAALAAAAKAQAVPVGLAILGLVAAAGLAQLFPWLGAGLGLVGGAAYASLLISPKGSDAASLGPAGPAIFVLVGLLAELAGRRLVNIERALVLGLHEPSGQPPHDEAGDPLARSRTGRTLAQELARARRYHFGVALALLEIADWQESLVRHGRVKMLELVNDFGRRLRLSLRPQDELTYVGAGRFALVLPHTDAAGAMITAARAGELLRQQGGFGLRAGVAEFPDDATTEEELFSEAEAALSADLVTESGVMNERQQPVTM